MFGGMPAAAETFQQHVATGKTLLELQSVSAMGDRGEMAIRDLTLQLRAGEIFGIAGVDGNGQKELGELIAGQRKTTAGRLNFDGADYTNRGVATLSKAGVGYITDDRMGEGVVPGMSVAQNAALKMINRPPFSKGFFLTRKAIEENANALIEQFSVKTPSADTRITLLSGGNIQKLMLARELAMNPRVIVCNKPTYGLDLKTAQFVLKTLREEADSGKAVLLISSELDEILEISDRIGVIYNGEIVATFDRAEIDRETIGRLMLSGRAAAQERVA
jgi:simple sugar transport system ATP-binding protein